MNAYGYQISIYLIFHRNTDPTISGMVSALQASKEATSRTDICENARQNIEAFGHKNFHFIIEHLGITANEVEEIAPCTPLQEGIVYHFLNSGGALYCSSFDFEFREPCDSAKLQNAWFRTQNEAQMLRVRLLPTPDGYAQVVLKDCQLPFFEVFVSSEEEIGDVRGLKFKEWAANLGDLSTNLWVIWLIRSPNKSVMCLNIFHALYDGSSLSRLLEKVARKYLGEDRTAKRELSFFDTLPLGPLCKDPSAESFWKEHLQDCHYKDVPKSHSPGHHSLTQKASISGLERVNKFRKSLNVTEQAVLHACWLLTLQQHFGFVPQLGVVVSGRALDIHEIENVIGPLFNTVPSNINFRGLKTWSDLVQRCHHYHISTIPYQHTPLRDIMKWTRRSQSNHLFDSLFVFRRSDAESTPLAESVWESRDSEAEHEYPLAFEVAHNDNESLSVTIAIQDKVMSMDSVRDILASFERHLYELLRNPSQELPQTMDHTAIEEAEGKTPNDYPQDSHDGSFRWTSQASNIRDIMADLTGVDKQSVGAGTSIFEFGLDSIDAIKLSSRLKKLDIHLPVSIIMRHRTIRGMMEHLASSNHVTQDAGAPSIGQLENRLAEFLRQEIQFPKDACRVLPATPIQEAMVAEMVASDYVHYYNHDILELEPHVDPVKLLDAWKAVVNANPILRTSFVEVWDPKIPISYAQIVHNEGTVDIQKVDLHAQPVDTIIQNQRTRALSALTQRPPLTISLAMSNGKCYLVLSMAHSLYDGWSMDLLHEDVARSYAGVCRQRPPYDDVLGHVLASSGERASKFWRATLANYIPKPFPKGKQAGNDGMTIHRQERAFTHLPTNVDDFCKLHGVTMQALCVTCWALVLAGYVGNPDVVFGLVLSGRNTADSEHVMFPTMNTVAMRAILHGRRIDMVKYVQSTLVDVGEHQHFPLRRARPDIGSRQLFDTLFIYQKGRSGSASKLPRLYKSTGGSASIEFPVCVEIESLAEAVVCRVACRDSVFGSPECLGLLERMEQVLSSILRGPEHQTIEFVDGAMRISGCSVQTCEPRLNGVAHSHVDSSIQDKTEWSSLELRIRNVLSVVSGIPEGEIDKETTIFQLGLDSISAIKVSSLLKKQAVKLTVSDMLKSGTIGKMALAANRKTVELSADDVRTALARSLEGIDSASLLHHRGIGPEQVERILPVTPGQIYFLSMNALNPNAFHPSFYYLASENLNPSVLNGAWERLTEEAAMLRTSFVPTNVKHPPAIQVVMKTALSPVIWNCERQDRVSWESPRGMNRLVPAALFASQTTRGTALQLRVHHALYDGVSLPKIMEMLVAFCSNGSLRPQVDHTQLASFVAFQSIHSPVNVRRQFWEGYLGTNSSEAVKQYQDNYTGPAEHLYRPGLVPNMSKVEEIAKRKSLSIQSIFLAVYAKVHAYAQGRPKDQPKSKPMAVGMYLANRSYAMEGLSDLVAPTVNIVPLRIDDKHGEGSLFAYARKIQEELNEISRVEYSAVSLLEISEWTGIQLDTCINFMKLPEIDGNPNGHQQLRMTPISAEDFQELNSPGENGKMESEGSGFVMETSSQRPNGFATPNGAEDETGHARANGTTDGLGGLREVFKVRDEVNVTRLPATNGIQPTMDVEAAIRNDRLDLGVFGLRSRLGGKLAESVIDGICQEMSRLTEGNEDADEDEDGHGHGHGV